MIRPERKHVVTGALVVTFLSQLGGHQEIHYQIAHLAMGIETGTLIALFLSSRLKQTSAEFSRHLNYLATVGLLMIGGCFAAIPATDDRYQAFFQNGRSITNPRDWPDFVSQSLLPDFEHHIELGIESGVRELNSLLILGKDAYYRCTNPALLAR